MLKIGYPLTMEDGTIIESAKGKILNYSDSSLSWKKYLDKQKVLAEGIEKMAIAIPLALDGGLRSPQV